MRYLIIIPLLFLSGCITLEEPSSCVNITTNISTPCVCQECEICSICTNTTINITTDYCNTSRYSDYSKLKLIQQVKRCEEALDTFRMQNDTIFCENVSEELSNCRLKLNESNITI